MGRWVKMSRILGFLPLLLLLCAVNCQIVLEGSTNGTISKISFVDVDVAFVLTTEHILYKAHDNLNDWYEQNIYLNSSTVYDFFTVPANSSKLVIVGGDGKAYKTMIQGGPGAYTGIVDLVKYLPHPAFESRGLGINGLLSNCEGVVHLTTDFCDSWKKIQINVCQATWLRRETDESLFVQMSDSDIPYSYSFHIVSTYPNWNERIFPGVYLIDHLIDSPYVFEHISDKGTSRMAASSNYAGAFNYLTTAFDAIDIKDLECVMLLNDLAVFALPSTSGHWGTLYMLDYRGQYILHRKDYVHGFDDGYSIASIAGLNGIFGVNIVDNPSAVANYGAFPHLRTFFTYDSASNFKTLECPTNECHGMENCSLHIHLSFRDDFESFKPILSSEDAIGLVIATGNCGPYLEHEHELLHTFISRDGGHNWTVLSENSTIFSFSNYGGLAVLMDHRGRYVTYSNDQFATSHTVALASSFFPISLETMNSGESLNMIGYGHHGHHSSGHYVRLDFSSVYSSSCTPATDYESFIPRGDAGDCLLGRSTTYSRLKNAKACRASNTSVVTGTTTCKCTRDDFECDFGFVEDVGDPTLCVSSSSQFYTGFTRLCIPGFSAPWVTGYIKIAGDGCTGGVESEYMPGIRECGVSSNYVLLFFAVCFVIYTILNIIAFSILALYVARKTEKGKILTRLVALKIKGVLSSKKGVDEESISILAEEMSKNSRMDGEDVLNVTDPGYNYNSVEN